MGTAARDALASRAAVPLFSDPGATPATPVGDVLCEICEICAICVLLFDVETDRVLLFDAEMMRGLPFDAEMMPERGRH